MVQMQIRTLFLVLVLIIFGVFVVLNWGAFVEPTTLSLGFGFIEAPLGLILLILLVLLLLLFVAYVVYLRTTTNLDVERYTKEMQAQRELIDQAETAHFAELREFLGAELRKIANRNNEFRQDVLAKLDKVDRGLRHAIKHQEEEDAAQKREEFKQKLQLQLDEWRNEIELLKAKAAQSGNETKVEDTQKVKELEEKVSDAEAKLAELADARDDTWESVRKRVENSWESLRNAISDTAARFKE